MDKDKINIEFTNLLDSFLFLLKQKIHLDVLIYESISDSFDLKLDNSNMLCQEVEKAHKNLLQFTRKHHNKQHLKKITTLIDNVSDSYYDLECVSLLMPNYACNDKEQLVNNAVIELKTALFV